MFVTLDQWRADALAAHGHPCARTPNLDRLAGEGVSFRNHFAQASPCGPARASLMTGLYAMVHRSVRNGVPLDSRFTNLALEARRLGFQPTLFGYTDTTPDPRTRPAGDPALQSYAGVLPGFDIGCPMNEVSWPWLAHLQAKGYDLPARPSDIYRPVDGGAGFAGPERHPPRPIYTAEDSDTAFLTDRVLEWLGPRTGQGWFIHLSYLRPHPPLIAPEPWASLIDPESVPLPARPRSLPAERAAHPLHDWLHAKHDAPDIYTGHDTTLCALGAAELRQMIATYFGLLAEVDHHLGRILDQLRATGELDETLVVVTGDHGELLGERWLFGKEGYFDSAFHVPLIIRDPDAETTRGTEVAAITEAVDVVPTILDTLGGVVPEVCDGCSLRPFVRQGRTPAGWRETAMFEFDFRDVAKLEAERHLGLAPDECALAALRGSRWKYVHCAGLPPLLFDLEVDPHESRNLAGDPAYAAIERDCAQALLSKRLLHADRTWTNTLLSEGGPTIYRGPRRAAQREQGAA
nr:alkaline phosphatase family protein [Rhodovibrio salinarum]